eukprot:10873787-Alexandrium_andersonii.AAC.1
MHRSSELKHQTFTQWSVMSKQLRIFEGSCSSNFGKWKTASGVRAWNCAGPGTASKSLPEAAE